MGLIKLHSNILLVNSGHHIGPPYCASHEGAGDNGNKVLNAFVNFHANYEIRLYKIYEDGNRILARTINTNKSEIIPGTQYNFTTTYS